MPVFETQLLCLNTKLPIAIKLSKLQFVSDKVTFLGHVITAEGKTLSAKPIAAIQIKPDTGNEGFFFIM